MSKFQLGDQVRITRGKWKDYIGTVTQITEASEELDTDEWCMVHVPERGACEMDFKAEMLEGVELAENELEQKFFENFLPGSNNSGDTETFLEMATVKWGFDSIKLAIYGDEGTGYPHFHFYKNLKPEGGIPESFRSGGGCLCIESPNYFVHASHTEKLDTKEIKDLIEFLEKKNKTFTAVTNWEYIIGQWNDANPDKKQLPMSLPIPDYRSFMETIQDDKKK